MLVWMLVCLVCCATLHVPVDTHRHRVASVTNVLGLPCFAHWLDTTHQHRERQRVRGKAEVITDNVGSSKWGPYDYIYAKYDLTHSIDEDAPITAGADKRTLYRRDRHTNSSTWCIASVTRAVLCVVALPCHAPCDVCSRC